MAGTEIPAGGGRGRLHLTLHRHHQNDFCVTVGSGESHSNVSFNAKGKGTKDCPYITYFGEKGEPKLNRTQPGPTYQPNALPLSQSGSLSEC